ncbi:MAG: ABC transporter ATP-binding protein [Fibrobacterota bacterium]
MQIYLSDKRKEEVLVEFEGVSLSFSGKKILDDISFSVKRGCSMAVLGKCGSGKTSLLKLCVGLHKPDDGKIFLSGNDLEKTGHKRMLELRLDAGFVFQNSALISNLSIFKNVCLPLEYHKTSYSQEQIAKTVELCLEMVNMEGEENNLPHQLSAGARRRAAVARAIALYPSIMFYDEPTSGLDPINKRSVIEILKSLRTGFGVTSILTTNDPETACELADTVLVLEDSRILFRGSPDEFRASTEPFIKKMTV